MFFCGFSGSSAAVVNVTTYGANGADASDDASAIQAAHNACGNGDTLYFPAGTYRLGTGISSTDQNTVVHWRGLNREQTVILAAGQLSRMIYQRNGGTFTNLTLDANSLAVNCIYGDYRAYTLINMALKNSTGNALQGSGPHTGDMFIKHTDVIDCFGGIYCSGNSKGTLLVDSLKTLGTTGYGYNNSTGAGPLFSFFYWRFAEVCNCSLSTTASSMPAANIFWSTASIHDNYYANLIRGPDMGIGCTNWTITGNTVRNCALGISLDPVLESGAHPHISMGNTIVRNNDVRNCQKGVYFTGCDALVENNTFDNMLYCMFEIEGVDRIRIYSNSLLNCRTNPLYALLESSYEPGNGCDPVWVSGNTDDCTLPVKYTYRGTGNAMFSDKAEKSLVMSDSFETALSGWTTSGSVQAYTGTPRLGSQSIRMTGQSLMAKGISTAGYENLVLMARIAAAGLASDTDCIAMVWNDGTNWHTLTCLSRGQDDGVFHEVNATLPETAANSPGFQLGFALVTASTVANAYVDNVELWGRQGVAEVRQPVAIRQPPALGKKTIMIYDIRGRHIDIRARCTAMTVVAGNEGSSWVLKPEGLTRKIIKGSR